MKQNDKNRLTLRVEPEIREEIERHIAAGDSRSMNQFLNEAVQRQLDYLDLRRAGSLLPREITAAIDGRISVFEHSMGVALFKLSTEVDLLNGLIADLCQLPEEELRERRAKSVQTVKKINGVTQVETYMRAAGTPDYGEDEWPD